MNKKFVVLVVEDTPTHQEFARQILAPVAEVLIAGSLREGMQFLRDRTDITHAVLDGYVPCFPNEPLRNGDTTLDIAFEIAEFRQEIKMYSASSDETMNQRLVEFGCVSSSKQTAPQMVADDIAKQKITTV